MRILGASQEWLAPLYRLLDVTMKEMLKKLPKGAIIGTCFAFTTYLYGRGIIGEPELELISQVAMALGVT